MMALKHQVEMNYKNRPIMQRLEIILLQLNVWEIGLSILIFFNE